MSVRHCICAPLNERPVYFWNDCLGVFFLNFNVDLPINHLKKFFRRFIFTRPVRSQIFVFYLRFSVAAPRPKGGIRSLWFTPRADQACWVKNLDIREWPENLEFWLVVVSPMFNLYSGQPPFYSPLEKVTWRSLLKLHIGGTTINQKSRFYGHSLISRLSTVVFCWALCSTPQLAKAKKWPKNFKPNSGLEKVPPCSLVMGIPFNFHDFPILVKEFKEHDWYWLRWRGSNLLRYYKDGNGTRISESRIKELQGFRLWIHL